MKSKLQEINWPTEAQILRSIQDYLTARDILHFRMNSGAMQIKDRFIRFGAPGMADLVAFNSFNVNHCGINIEKTVVYWIEAKTHKGVQSLFQKAFEKLVTERGHIYILARDVNDVAEVI